MKRYKVTLKHDNGKYTLIGYADNQQQAIDALKKAEKCPDSAILKIEIVPFYVTMTDKFMSGWGKAEGKINKFIIECEDFKHAEIIERNANKRPEMKHVGIKFKKPYYSPKGYIISMEKYENLGEIWKK